METEERPKSDFVQLEHVANLLRLELFSMDESQKLRSIEQEGKSVMEQDFSWDSIPRILVGCHLCVIYLD